MAGALCSEPAGSGRDIATSLPVTEAVLRHWRSMIDLWFILAQSRLSKGAEEMSDSERSNSFRYQLLTLWEKNKLPPTFKTLYLVGVTTTHIIIWGSWGLASYHIMLNAKNSIPKIKDNNADSKEEGENSWQFAAWWGLIFVWIGATGIICSISLSMQAWWHFVTHGWRQGWLFESQMDFSDYRALDAIRGALRERKSTNPRDKAYALHGVLRANGATPSAADYSWSVGKTYQTLVKDLLTYDPAAIPIVMDGSCRGRFDRPTWVPNWQVSVPSAWLTCGQRLGMKHHRIPFSSCTPFRKNPCFNISGTQLRLRGTCKGAVTFQVKVNPSYSADMDMQSDRLEMNIRPLLLWWAHVRKEVPRKDLNNRPISSLFAVLDGLSPRRGPTGV